LFSSGTGTAATPAIQPAGDTNTGIFFPAADTIAFSDGGAEAMRIDSSGNVGIGISPSQKLDVNGVSAIRGTLFLGDGSSSVVRKLTASTPLTFANNGGSAEMTIDSSGNVGIGGTPSALLHIQATSPALRIQAASGNSSVIDFYRTASVNSGQIASESTNALVFSTNGVGNSGLAERLRIDSSGNVGVGTASPSALLHVSGSGATAVKINGGTSANQGPSLKFQKNSTDTLILGVASAILGGGSTSNDSMIYTEGTNNTIFYSNAAERLRIDSSGNVGIGTISPDAKLAIDAPGGSTPTAPISCNATSGAGDRYAALFRYSGTLSGSVTVNGAAAAYNTSSDYRLKTNLEPISNGIERIKQLPVYRFNWKTNENGNKVDGFVAHEVTPIVREAIHGEKDAVDADGNPIYQGIDQSKIVPLLTAALKEAIAKIEVLESKVATLEAA
jgi:hypothetical protein